MLKELIKNLKLKYVNPNITEENFPPQEISKGEYKIFTTDKWITMAEIEARMEKDGLRPANLYELLSWAENNWDGTDWLVALGSVWVHSGSHRSVPCLGEDGSGRSLHLYWDGPSSEWGDCYRFLVVSKSLDTRTLVASESDTLSRLASLEADMAKLKEIIKF